MSLATIYRNYCCDCECDALRYRFDDVFLEATNQRASSHSTTDSNEVQHDSRRTSQFTEGNASVLNFKIDHYSLLKATELQANTSGIGDWGLLRNGTFRSLRGKSSFGQRACGAAYVKLHNGHVHSISEGVLD